MKTITHPHPSSRSSNAPRPTEDRNKQFRNLEVLVLGLIRDEYEKKKT